MNIIRHTKSSCLNSIKKQCTDFALMVGKDLNWKHWQGAVGALIDNGVAEVLIAYENKKPIGMIIYTFFPDLITGESNSTELAWYVDPEHRNKKAGVLLLDMMVDLAKEKDCKNINMTHMHLDARISSLLTRKGFRKYETNYTMRID